MQADYVIIGAGSAGCVLANRLTEDPTIRVVLIEAGGSDWNPLIHIPVGYMKLLDHKQLTWGFKADADPGTNGRAIAYPRGGVLGGSSSINGLIYIRSQPEDYDYWAQLGNRGWGWDDVLPFFKRAERWTGEKADIHGTEGNLTTSPMTEQPEACRAIIRAAQELGLEYRPDVNNLPRGAGASIGWCQQTRGGRRRASAAATYLRPAKSRPNLRVVTNALVHRVLFNGKRAAGVEFSRQSVVERIDAGREVIASAGAIGSPHLLQLSGIGGPEVLQKAGIAVRHPLPGVGQNFQDHYIARMSCYVRNLETLNERVRGLGFANEVIRYFVQGKGMMTFGASLCAASVKVLPESATPDVQCVFAPASYKPGLIRKLDDRPGITGGPWQMRPLSRGYVLVRTPDPHDQLAINPRYLAEDTDQRAIVGGLKFLRRLFAAPALAEYIIEENVPGPSVQSDEELLDYARSNGSTVYHASCSCMMGNHGMSVVDDQLRVHGLEALRVVDASVMPAVSSTNTNAPTIMIAEGRGNDQGQRTGEAGGLTASAVRGGDHRLRTRRNAGPAHPSAARAVLPRLTCQPRSALVVQQPRWSGLGTDRLCRPVGEHFRSWRLTGLHCRYWSHAV